MIAAELRGSSKPGLNEALGWIGSRVDDVYGASVGRLEDIWIDPGTGDPRWLLVKEGRFGGRSTLIPFEDASAGAGHVWVPYERDVVRGAPEVEPGAPLTQQVESALRDHYVSNAAVSHGDQAAAAVTPGAVSELAHEHQQPEHPPPQYPPRPAPQPPQMEPSQQQPSQQQPAQQYPQQQPAPIQYPQQAPPQRPAPIQYPQQQPQQQPAPIQYPQQAPRPAPQAPDPGPYSRNDAGPPAALSFPGPPEEHPREGSTPVAARQTPQPPVAAAPPMRPPAPPMRPPAPIQYRPDPAAVPMPQVARAEQHTPAPPAAPESLPQRPAVPPQPQPAVVATPPQQGYAEQPTAIPVIHALDRPYRVEIQLEGDLKISGELKGFSLTPTDESAD